MGRQPENTSRMARLLHAATWSRFIARLSRRLTRSFPEASDADIEDSVADAVARWWVRNRDLDDSRMATWVSMHARWRLLDTLRRDRLEVLDEKHLVVAGPDALIERMEVLERALHANLGRSTEVVISLRLLGWTIAEIAKHLRVSENAVRKRLERAVIRLRKACVDADDRNECHISPRSFVIRMGEAEDKRDERRKGREGGREEGSTFHASAEVISSFPVRSAAHRPSFFPGSSVS